jgi:hypothetical protein
MTFSNRVFHLNDIIHNKMNIHISLTLSIVTTCYCMLILSLLFSYSQPTIAQKIGDNISISPTNGTTTIVKAKSQMQWSIYTNSKFGFSIEYPNTWKVQEKQNRFEKGSDLAIESNESIFNPNNGKFTFSYVGKTPFNDVTVLTNIAANEMVANFEAGYEKRLIESPDIQKYKIGGQEAGAFTYVLEKKDYSSDTTSSYNTLGTAAEVVNTIHNGQAYIVQFIASAENFDNPILTQIRQHMFNSIKWLR